MGIHGERELSDLPAGSHLRKHRVSRRERAGDARAIDERGSSSGDGNADASLRNSFARLRQVPNQEMHSGAQVFLRVRLKRYAIGDLLRLYQRARDGRDHDHQDHKRNQQFNQ